jgi:hypothetical protein
MMELRETIVEQIKRLAAQNDGKPLGRRAFEQETGIRERDWLGKIWARWGDALVEAGFEPNTMRGKADRSDLLSRLADVCAHYGRMPTAAEFELVRVEKGLPSYSTYENNFGREDEMVAALREWLSENGDQNGLLSVLPEVQAISREVSSPRKAAEGFVYLLRSGRHFKIGRSEDLERRVKQVSVALPEAVQLEHAIRTDDPAGIEAYWHRRFADKRANGEWFALSGEDVRAFKRRSFQ